MRPFSRRHPRTSPATDLSDPPSQGLDKEAVVLPKKWHQRAAWRLLIVAAVLVLIAAWRAGSFDHALVNVGLNAKPCARNGFGATFCGTELEEYRARIRRVKTEGEAAESKIRRLQRQSEEDNQRSQELVKRSQEEAAASGQRAQELARRSQEEGSP